MSSPGEICTQPKGELDPKNTGHQDTLLSHPSGLTLMKESACGGTI